MENDETNNIKQLEKTIKNDAKKPLKKTEKQDTKRNKNWNSCVTFVADFRFFGSAFAVLFVWFLFCIFRMQEKEKWDKT